MEWDREGPAVGRTGEGGVDLDGIGVGQIITTFPVTSLFPYSPWTCACKIAGSDPMRATGAVETCPEGKGNLWTAPTHTGYSACFIGVAASLGDFNEVWAIMFKALFLVNTVADTKTRIVHFVPPSILYLS